MGEKKTRSAIGRAAARQGVRAVCLAIRMKAKLWQRKRRQQRLSYQGS